MNAATGSTRGSTPGGWTAPEVMEPAWVTALCLTEGPEDAETLLVRAARRAARREINASPVALLRALVAEHGVDVGALETTEVPAARGRSAAAMVAHWSAGCLEPRLHTPAELEPATVVAGIRALPAGYRALAALYYATNQSYDEVARILEVPVAAVRVRIRQSRPMLHRTLALLDIEP